MALELLGAPEPSFVRVWVARHQERFRSFFTRGELDYARGYPGWADDPLGVYSIAPAEASAAHCQPGPYIERGLGLLQQRRFAEAIAEGFEPALRIFESRRPVGRLQAARAGGGAALMAALRLTGGDEDGMLVGAEWPDTMYLRAFTLIELGDRVGAVQQLRNALSLMPNDVVYSCELAHLKQGEGRWEESVVIYQAGLENAEMLDRVMGSDAIIVGQSIDDWRRRAMRGIGFSLVELDRLEEAAAIYREVLAINPSDAQARRELDSIVPRLQHL